jgi:hypothetical protein
MKTRWPIAVAVAALAAIPLLTLDWWRSDASVVDPGPQLLVSIPWGSGDGQAGRTEAEESAPCGPMSFAVTPAGRIHVLDQVNRRVLRFDPAGAPLAPVPIGSDTFQDIEIGPDGELVLLDRLVDGAVVVLDGAGEELARHGVVGTGIAQGGGITAMLLRDDGLWLEYNHQHSVRVLDGGLEPCARDVRPGRLLPGGGRGVVAELAPPSTARLRVVEVTTGAVLAERSVVLDGPLARIVWIEADAAGDVHAMFHVLSASAASGERVVALKLDGASLQEKGSFESPFTITEHEQFRELRVTDSGVVHQMAFTEEGVKLLAWGYEP